MGRERPEQEVPRRLGSEVAVAGPGGLREAAEREAQAVVADHHRLEVRVAAAVEASAAARARAGVTIIVIRGGGAGGAIGRGVVAQRPNAALRFCAGVPCNSTRTVVGNQQQTSNVLVRTRTCTG